MSDGTIKVKTGKRRIKHKANTRAHRLLRENIALRCRVAELEKAADYTSKDGEAE